MGEVCQRKLLLKEHFPAGCMWVVLLIGCKASTKRKKIAAQSRRLLFISFVTLLSNNMAWRSYESPLGRIAKVFDADIIRFAEPTPPNMKMMDLLDCLKQNEHQVGHWEYADAAETALALSQEIQNGLLIPVLLQRAYALAKARRLDDAIEVAQRILMLANDRPEGYVLMASVYLKKNWARNALLITRQGLKRVPTEHPFWTHLRARKEHVEKVIQNHNMRVLKRLPYDICFNIFSRLSFVDLLQCAQTCNSWFRFFMDFDAMWYILDFTGINMKALSLYDTNKVVSRVREVVFPTAQDNTMSGVLTFLVTQKVSDLQSIGMSLASNEKRRI